MTNTTNTINADEHGTGNDKYMQIGIQNVMYNETYRELEIDRNSKTTHNNKSWSHSKNHQQNVQDNKKHVKTITTMNNNNTQTAISNNSIKAVHV